jgi:membrane protein required for colicin V production
MGWTWFDWTIVVCIVASVIGGLVSGFFRTACSLIGLLLGLSVAAWNYHRVAAFLMPLVRIETVANTIAFFLIAIVIMALFSFLGTILGRTFQKLGLGCLDMIGGGVLGFIQGLVMVMIGILVAVAFFPKAQWLVQSQLPRQFFGALHVSTKITPQDLAEKVREGLRLLEQESPPWMHPGQGST